MDGTLAPCGAGGDRGPLGPVRRGRLRSLHLSRFFWATKLMLAVTVGGVITAFGLASPVPAGSNLRPSQALADRLRPLTGRDPHTFRSTI